MHYNYNVFYDHQLVLTEKRKKKPMEFLDEMLNKYPNFEILKITWLDPLSSRWIKLEVVK